MSKIYVVTKGKGSYGDYHIITATADEEVANKIAKNFNEDSDKINIEIFEDAELYINPVWIISFDSDGDVISVRESTNEYDFGCINQITFFNWYEKAMFIYVSAENEEQAIEIASKKRAEFLSWKEKKALHKE